MNHTLAAGFALLTLAGCSPDNTSNAQVAGSAQPTSTVAVADPAAAARPSTAVLYDFEAPAAQMRLVEALREVSGIAFLPDGRIAAVQDEAGILYMLDAATGAVVDERPFAGPGDYEDVEHAAGAVWVLGADGTLYEIPDDGSAPHEHDTPLKKKCDAEGLALDVSQDRLLIACKEDPGEGLSEDEVKAVYAFTLETRTLNAAPVLLLPRTVLDEAEHFKPSALAVHPQTGEIYILSSVRNAIAVVSPAGEVTSVTELPEALNAQPEGLAFTADGTLYIANEGGNGMGTISRFAPAR
ncbi:MAG TPA: SdiA-regulated domain-containing protein [Rubricoccaceae bacterium]|jgi:uncharacterized protein YjiK